MKICIISNLYPPYARGGAEQVVHKIVDELLRLGHKIVLITLTPRKDEREVSGNVMIYRIHPRNIFFYTDAHHHNFLMRTVWHIFDIFNFDARAKVRKILEEEKPDLVHTHNLMGLGFLLPRLLRAQKIPHVHTIHDVQLVEPSGIILKSRENSWRYRGLPTRLYTSIMKQLFASPNVVISPSQFLLQFYEDRGFFSKSKRVVMRNPVTLTPCLEKKKKNDIFSCLYVGQIEDHKGVKFLIETFLQFLESYPNSELHVVGSGSCLSELQKHVETETRIFFHGKVERSELPKFFESSDITVVPSLCYENSPTVIFESFSYSTPVLASNIEGIAELIKENENGLTFTSGDSVALLQKLKWCSETRPKLLDMGENGKFGISDLSQEKYLQRLFDLYNEILSRSG